jgi:hypothetical protein
MHFIGSDWKTSQEGTVDKKSKKEDWEENGIFFCVDPCKL